ncbi:hypothetical protein TNCV_3279441 [Trichonephila clavipes]|nr:hypothetical protein TNCV_3279441 [Trichonephila clavipes]
MSRPMPNTIYNHSTHLVEKCPSISSRFLPILLKQTPLGFREEFEESTWFCAGCTGAKGTAWAFVFCDSKTVTFAVNSNSTPASSNILDGKKRPQSLSEDSKEIVLKWIPGHCGVTGKELADHLAKKGASIQQGKLSLLPVLSILLRKG